MTNCNVCGSELKIIPAGVSKKTGKSYSAFTACPNKCKTSWNNPSPKPQNEPIASLNEESVQIIMDEFRGLNKRLDEMAHFLVEKLGSNKKDEVNVKEIPFG